MSFAGAKGKWAEVSHAGCELTPCEVKHRMTRRCDGWDYRAQAIYQITLVQADRRRPVLGRLVIDDPSASRLPRSRLGRRRRLPPRNCR